MLYSLNDVKVVAVFPFFKIVYKHGAFLSLLEKEHSIYEYLAAALHYQQLRFFMIYNNSVG